MTYAPRRSELRIAWGGVRRRALIAAITLCLAAGSVLGGTTADAAA